MIAVDDYIKREAAIGVFDGIPSFGDMAKMLIACVPAADVVEVVRCENCEHHHDMVGESYVYCVVHNDKRCADDYCSSGAKMNRKGEGE